MPLADEAAFFEETDIPDSAPDGIDSGDMCPEDPEGKPAEDHDIPGWMTYDEESDDAGDGNDDDDLLSAVFTGDNTDDVNQTALMTVAVDYVFKRGKIKKSIRKICRKLIKKHALETEQHQPAGRFAENCCKRFVGNVFAEYGENPDQALDIAYFGAVWLVSAFREDMKGISKNEKDVWPFLVKHVKPEELQRKALKQLQDKKGKSVRILNEYTERLNVNEIWDNIDGRMKKKILKGAFWLGALKAMKH
ncbi:MAG: hypothetical protein Q4G19_01425 [Clostridia bacterium]|nr:hypothetical protein [Clostridia bacterium]